MEMIFLKAIHFLNSSDAASNRPIAKAAKKYFRTDNVQSYDHYTVINDKPYYHTEYNITTENCDHWIARALLYLPIPIRIIYLYADITKMPEYRKYMINTFN